MMIAANYETAVGSVSQCRGMSNMSVQISPKMIYLVRARVQVVVVVEVNGSWARGGGRGGNRSKGRTGEDSAGEDRTRQN